MNEKLPLSRAKQDDIWTWSWMLRLPSRKPSTKIK